MTCTILVNIIVLVIFAKTALEMIIISSREFRANQRKYLDLARTKEVVITSRTNGSFRLVPVRDEDLIIDRVELRAKIKRGISEYQAGRAYPVNDGENMDDYLNRLLNEP